MSVHHTILGVSHTATREEIRRAYRKKAMLVHPDRAEFPDEEEFIKLTKAYQMLMAVKKAEGNVGHTLFSPFEGLAPLKPSACRPVAVDMTGWALCDYCNGLGESALGVCPRCKGRGRVSHEDNCKHKI